MFCICCLKLKKENPTEKCPQMLHKEGCRKKECFNSNKVSQHCKSLCEVLSFLRSPNNCIFCSKTRSIKSIHDSHVYVFNKWMLYTRYLKEDLI